MGLLSSVACHVAIVPGASLRARVWVAPARLAATFCRKNGTDRRFGTVRTPQNHVFGVDLSHSFCSHQAKRSCPPLPALTRPYQTVNLCHSGRKTWRRDGGGALSPRLRRRGSRCGARLCASCRVDARPALGVEPLRPPPSGVKMACSCTPGAKIVRCRTPNAEAARSRAPGPGAADSREIDVPAKAAPVPIPDARARSTQLPPFARKVAAASAWFVANAWDGPSTGRGVSPCARMTP